MTSQDSILIADIGGTNARLAFLSPVYPFYTQAETFQCADFSNVEGAIDEYLRRRNTTHFKALCFAVAGPIQNESVQFINNSWQLNTADLCTRYQTQDVALLNDFTAISHSLAHLASQDRLAIGGDWSLPSKRDYTFGIVGPGSGLGVGTLCKRNSQMIVLDSEGGHVGFAAENSLQRQVLSLLQAKFERVSRERLLSGPGIINLYNALCDINNTKNENLTAADITQRGADQTDAVCQQTLALFFEILGQVSGDIVLSFGAYEGLFIGGGISQRFPQALLESRFRAGFTNKGRYRELMEKVPTWLITHTNAGLLGCGAYALARYGTQ